MSEMELFFNKLGIKLISENIKLSDLKEEDIDVYFIDRNKWRSLDMKTIEAFDKKLLDGLILNYGGLGAVVKLECLLDDIRIARERLGNSLASSNLWLLLISLKEFKKRLEKLCIIDIEKVLLKAFINYTNGKNAVVLEDFISSFSNQKVEAETLGLDAEGEEDNYSQISLIEDMPKKEKYVVSPLGKAVFRRQSNSTSLYIVLSKANMLLEFIDFGCTLTEGLKSKGTLEAIATAKVVSAAIKDIVDSSKYQIKKKDKNIPGQLTLGQIN